MSSMISKETMALMQKKAMFVGEYVLNGIEHVSDDGKSIICNVCGKIKFEAKSSKLLGGVAWILYGDGCDCQRRQYRTEKERRIEYGSKLRKEDSRNFAWDYCMQNWMLESVPGYLVNASILDRFYMQHYSENIGLVRTIIDNIKEDPDVLKEGVFIYGQPCTLKTSLLCCIRKTLLDFTVPAIMMTVRNLIKNIAVEGEKKDKLYDVNVLLVDNMGVERLSERQSAMLENIFDYRRRCSKGTVFASKVDLESLQQRGYSKPLIGCIDNSGKTLRIEMQQLS